MAVYGERGHRRTPPRGPPARGRGRPSASLSPRRRAPSPGGARQRRDGHRRQDSPEYGAEGIGLARTEHMLLGDRRELVEQVVTETDRDDALARIEELTRADFLDILDVMDGLPGRGPAARPAVARVPARPGRAVDEGRRSATTAAVATRSRAPARGGPPWHEVNPMLGLRGVRLLAVVPELLDAQVRALGEAVVDLLSLGRARLAWRSWCRWSRTRRSCAGPARVSRTVVDTGVPPSTGVDLDRPRRLMIELPRAALTSGRSPAGASSSRSAPTT